jgi:hypothetical protein
MPITYVIDRLHRRMLTHADGVLTFHDVDRHLDEEEHERGLDLPELFDARGAKTDLTSAQVRRLVHRAAEMMQTVPLGPTAIVATDDTLYGMARMYGILAEPLGVSVEVFRDVGSAERWLNQVG